LKINSTYAALKIVREENAVIYVQKKGMQSSRNNQIYKCWDFNQGLPSFLSYSSFGILFLFPTGRGGGGLNLQPEA
jgi:hypothetical protein